ncbi:BrnT family toxin [Candidatus Woesebacteria bacterium]|nr:BrnT family toxin [Candidatus Woesebacteria bacterium]
MNVVRFEWDEEKNILNEFKHGVSFEEAQRAFLDPNRIVYTDTRHSTENEIRYYCLGKIKDKICTVRFTHRQGTIRIFGAGYWRRGKKDYEKNTQ